KPGDRVAPGVALQRAAGERDALGALLVLALLDLDHLHLDLLADGEDVLRMRGAGVADLADVQHALDAAEIDEHAVGGQRGDLALEDGADLELLARLGGARLLLLLE